MRPRTARQAHGSVPSTPRRSRESAFVPREYQAARWHCERLAQMWAREPGAERKHAAAYTHSCQWPSHRQSHLMPAHMQAPSVSGGPSLFDRRKGREKARSRQRENLNFGRGTSFYPSSLTVGCGKDGQCEQRARLLLQAGWSENKHQRTSGRLCI